MTPDPDKLYDYCRDHKGLAEDMILVQSELGIKQYKNGARDQQIQEALQRIKQVGDRAEEEDKTLSERLIVVETDMASVKTLVKIILTAILSLIFMLILFFIEFQWKTFILGM